MKRNYTLFVFVIFMLCGCGANRPLPTIAVLPSDTPHTSIAPAITVVATLAVDTGKPTLQVPSTPTITPIFSQTPILPTMASSPTLQPVLTRSNAPDNREIATCQRILELFSAIQINNKGDFPDDFPKPPDGSVACGIDGPGSVHYSNTLDANSVAAYYREKMTAWGCITAQDKEFKPNWITLRFDCPKGMVHIATNPDITEFIVRYVSS